MGQLFVQDAPASLVAAVGEHREGVCLSARYFVDYIDEICARLDRACEALGDGDGDLAHGVVADAARELRGDAAIVLAFVESFDRRASVRH